MQSCDWVEGVAWFNTNCSYLGWMRNKTDRFRES
jgi:hypothetical protein